MNRALAFLTRIAWPPGAVRCAICNKPIAKRPHDGINACDACLKHQAGDTRSTP